MTSRVGPADGGMRCSSDAGRLPGGNQQGQVLVLGMLLAGAVAFAFVHHFETGTVLAEKVRQDHVLDAAAYSGALVQARSLNMLAYIHRAQAAHQVAMAHLVTLGSLAHFAGTEAQRAAMANPPAYVIAMHFGPEHAAAYLSALQASGLEAVAVEGGSLASAYARHDASVRTVLASAASRVAEGLVDTRNQAMQEVLRANYPGETDFHLRMVDDDTSTYLVRQSGQAVLAPFMRRIAQLYAFLEPRNETRRSLFPVSARCPTRRHELRRRGMTVLDDQGRWQSVDTQAYHALRSNRWIGCYYREYPMGWGWILPEAAAELDLEYVGEAPDTFGQQDFWRWVQQSTAWNIATGDGNPLATSWGHANRQAWQGGGLPSYHDLASDRRLTAAHFTVELERLRHDGVRVRSRSAAEAYFRRPHERADRRRELASTFHPYWHARLRTPAAAPGEN